MKVRENSIHGSVSLFGIRGLRQSALRVVLGMILSGGAFGHAQSAPPNDDFENRIVLAGESVTFTGTLNHATVQPGEPAGTSEGSSWPYSYGANRQDASVWWSWTANKTGPVTLEVLGFSTNVFKLGGLDVWAGTNWSSGFNFVGGINLDMGRHPFVTFSGTEGTNYQVRAIGTNCGSFILRMTETNMPIIAVQPASRTVSANGSVFFGIVAAGAPPSSPPFTYQWRFNGVDLPGETFPILGLDNLATNQSGSYSIVVSNANGGTVSAIAVLNVTESVSPAQLVSTGAANGQFEFRILGEAGRLFRIQSSTNLLNWSEEKSFPKEFIYYGSLGKARNSVVYNNQSILSVPQSSPQKFYRTSVYTPANAVCINNLAKIRFAIEIWSHENKAISTTAVAPDDIIPYIRPGSLFCPLDTNQSFYTSYSILDVMSDPLCMISFGHVLEAPEY